MIALDASRRSSTPHSRSWPNRSSRRSHNRSAARLARGERHAWFLCLGTGETWYLVGLTALPLSCAEATRAAADEVRCARGASAPGRQRARRRLQRLVSPRPARLSPMLPLLLASSHADTHAIKRQTQWLHLEVLVWVLAKDVTA